jgi:DNA-binding MarR family transcriptional regulator
MRTHAITLVCRTQRELSVASLTVPDVTRPEFLRDQWFSRDALVLREVARAFEADFGARPAAADIADALGMDPATVEGVGVLLRDAGFVEGIDTDQGGIVLFTALTPTGRREVGLWPSPETAAERLLASVDGAIERAPEGEQKTRLTKLRDGLLGISRDLLVDIASGVLTKQIGG